MLHHHTCSSSEAGTKQYFRDNWLFSRRVPKRFLGKLLAPLCPWKKSGHSRASSLNCSSLALKCEQASESPVRLVNTLVAGPILQRFWFSRSGARPENEHFWQVPRCCWSRDRTWEALHYAGEPCELWVCAVGVLGNLNRRDDCRGHSR